MITTKLCCATMLGYALAWGPSLAAQVQTEVPPVAPGAKPVTVEHIKVHGKALEGNLEGDAADRDVFVFLPPSYATEKDRRYPVVYALHGYSIGAEQWTHEIHVPQTIEGAFAQGAKETIVVLPDSKNRTQRLHVFQFGHHGRFSSGSSGTIWLPTSTRTTAPLRSARAGVWWATPWAATAQRGSG